MPDTRIAVIFYSATGNVAALAEVIAGGATEAGQAWRDENPYDTEAALDDLVWADGFAFGSPTRFGLPAAQLKQFLDTSGGLWGPGKLGPCRCSC